MKTNPIMTVFDGQYPAVKQAEGLGVHEAVVSGKCEKCRHFYKCTVDEDFSFPLDAPCMIIRDQILKEWEA